jgi:hypothetical protein
MGKDMAAYTIHQNPILDHTLIKLLNYQQSIAKLKNHPKGL